MVVRIAGMASRSNLDFDLASRMDSIGPGPGRFARLLPFAAGTLFRSRI